MKHGPIALIDEMMPVVFVVPHDAVFDKVVSSIQEVKARKGKIIAITSREEPALKGLLNHEFRIPETVDLAFAPGGAFEMMLELKAKGAARFIGVTGHQQPEANLRAIHYWDQGLKFDVMQMPLNPMDYHQQSFQRYVLPELVRRDIGVIAMKTSADGALLREKVCSIDECLRYAWSLPISLAVVGMVSPAHVRENAARARSFSAYTDAERRSLLARIAPRAALSLEWYKSGPSDGRGG